MTFGLFAGAGREPTRKMAGDETCFFHYSAGDQKSPRTRVEERISG
jgi:hypothetical protein